MAYYAQACLASESHSRHHHRQGIQTYGQTFRDQDSVIVQTLAATVPTKGEECHRYTDTARFNLAG